MSIKYEVFKEGEEILVNKLVVEVFSKYIGCDYSQKGQNTFKEYVKAANILERFSNGTDFIVLAKDEDKVVGVISIKNNMAIKLAQEVVYKKVILTPDEIFLFV
jgi:hypothetical protein